MQAFFLKSDCKVYLDEIRRSIIEKRKNEPKELTADDFIAWKSEHDGYILHKGYLSIWNGITIPDNACEIVIEKRMTRENAKPFLIFNNPGCFKEYCRHSHLLGVEVYSLFEDRFDNTIKSIATTYSAPLSSYDILQEEVEKFVGLNFKIEDDEIADEHLYASLYNYLRKVIPQKAYTVFKSQGIIIDIDIYDFENLFSTNDDEFISSVTCAYVDDEKIDLKAMVCKISDMMVKLTSDKNTKFDIKDNLLRQIVYSDRATGEFVLYYYSLLNNRKSLWRPIAFSYQVQYSHDHGEMYLKNPTFVQKCAAITIGEMISSQIESYSNSDKIALRNMSVLSDKAREEGVYQKPLSECAENTEQIGKSLSKELRTEEAKSALTRALLITALEKEQMTSFYDAKGDEYHE